MSVTGWYLYCGHDKVVGEVVHPCGLEAGQMTKVMLKPSSLSLQKDKQYTNLLTYSKFMQTLLKVYRRTGQ